MGCIQWAQEGNGDQVGMGFVGVWGGITVRGLGSDGEWGCMNIVYGQVRDRDRG